MKRVIYPLFSAQDESKVSAILGALKKKGVTVRGQADSPARDDALLLFLSKDLKADGPAAEAFFRLNEGRELIIPVNLDGCTPPEDLQDALMARHTISAEKYSEAELAGLIEKALQGGKGSRLPLILSAAAAVILLAVGGLFLWRNQPAPVAEATPEPTAEPTPAPTEAPTPTPKPTVEGIDLDLSLVAEVVYVGDTFKYYSMFDGYHMTGSSDVRSYRELAYESWENGTLRFYSTENGQEIPMGELGDISYLKLLPNLLYLTFVNVKGEIPDLSKSFNLNGVTIINCDIPDIQGLAGCGMDQFHYEGGSVKDFSPLNDCARLQNADISPWGDPAGADFSDFHLGRQARGDRPVQTAAGA